MENPANNINFKFIYMLLFWNIKDFDEHDQRRTTFDCNHIFDGFKKLNDSRHLYSKV